MDVIFFLDSVFRVLGKKEGGKKSQDSFSSALIILFFSSRLFSLREILFLRRLKERFV